MKGLYLKGFIGLCRTLSRSQTKIIKGVSIALNWCNAHALGDFRVTLKFIIDGKCVKKHHSLPTTLPNEF
jgi:hypothetical protein